MHDVHTLYLQRGEHRYIVLHDDANQGEALRTLGRWASDPQLNFDWRDAAKLSQVIRTGTSKGVDHVSAIPTQPGTDPDRQ